MKINAVFFPLVVSMLATGCASKSAPETVNSWQERARAAWTSMSDNGKPVEVEQLEGYIAQNGMSSDQSVTFVAFPKVGETLSRESIRVSIQPPGKNTRTVSRADLAIVPVGRALKVTVNGLTPDTEYTVRANFPENSSVELRTRTAPGLKNHASSVSMLLTSCNEPWSRSDDESIFPRVAPSTANALRLLDLRASGDLPILLDGKESLKPSLLLGLGDQAYVDAEPTKKGSLAFFGGKRSDENKLLIDSEGDWESVLESIYRMHFLVPTFDRALRSLPNAMVWDDHEIRDGWGSQGNEAEGIWPEYFALARQKAWEFEAARNPVAGAAGIDQYSKFSKQEMDTRFQWGTQVKVFLMDTRTSRQTSRESIDGKSQAQQPVASSAQLERIEKWLEGCGQKPSVYVLGVPVPLTLDRERSFFSKLFGAGELRDDIIDGWGWPGHEDARGRLIKAMKSHAKDCRDDRIVVVSGDVHESNLHALFDEDGKVYAYEIISSGTGTLIDKQFGVNKAQISTLGTKIVGPVAQVGRIAGGASFAELFIELDGVRPPELKVLFYSTTGAYATNQKLKSTLVNAAPWVKKQEAWSTGSTSVDGLFKGKRRDLISPKNLALQLDYKIPPPPKKSQGTNYGLTSAAMRCEVSNSNVVEEFASDWTTVKADLGQCVTQ